MSPATLALSGLLTFAALPATFALMQEDGGEKMVKTVQDTVAQMLSPDSQTTGTQEQ